MPQFLSKDELLNKKITCPYYSIRAAIAVTAYECSDILRYRIEHLESSRHRNAVLNDAKKYLQKAAEYLDKMPYRRNCPLPEEYWFNAINKIEMRRQWQREYEKDIDDFLLIEQVIAAIERRKRFEKETVQGSNKPSWRSLFIEGMGRTWRDLTGVNPPHSVTDGPFSDFAKAAFVSLHETDSYKDLTVTEFRSTHERTMGLSGNKGRHELNRYDAGERRQERVNEQRRERFEYRLYLRKEYKREVDEGTYQYWMIESNEEELRREFDQAPPSEQDYFRSIGYSPDPAGDPNEERGREAKDED